MPLPNHARTSGSINEKQSDGRTKSKSSSSSKSKTRTNENRSNRTRTEQSRSRQAREDVDGSERPERRREDPRVKLGIGKDRTSKTRTSEKERSKVTERATREPSKRNERELKERSKGTEKGSKERSKRTERDSKESSKGIERVSKERSKGTERASKERIKGTERNSDVRKQTERRERTSTYTLDDRRSAGPRRKEDGVSVVRKESLTSRKPTAERVARESHRSSKSNPSKTRPSTVVLSERRASSFRVEKEELIPNHRWQQSNTEDEDDVPEEMELSLEGSMGMEHQAQTASNTEYDDDEFEDYESDFEDDVEESEEDSDESTESSEDDFHEENDGSAKKPENHDSGLFSKEEEDESGESLQPTAPPVELINTSPQNTVVAPPSQTATSIVNFSTAKKRTEKQKILEKIQKRSHALISMIKLDGIDYDILEIPSMQHGNFVRLFGNPNAKESSSQHNEDNIEDDTQTELIVTTQKWTQIPISFTVPPPGKPASQYPTPEDYKGVGGEEKEDYQQTQPSLNSKRLTQFILSAGQVMLNLLEETALNQPKQVKGIPGRDGESSFEVEEEVKMFSQSYHLGAHETEFLNQRPITCVICCPTQSNLLLTIHGKSSKNNEEADLSHLYQILCVWNLLQPMYPWKVLLSPSVPVITIWSGASFIISGMQDGSIAIWDLRELSGAHVQTTLGDWVYRSPSYVTVHSSVSTVTALQSMPSGVASLNESGNITSWVFAESTEPVMELAVLDSDLGLAHWGRVRLVKSADVNIVEFLSPKPSEELRSLDFVFHPENPNHLYICTDKWGVIHCTTHGAKAEPSRFATSDDPDCMTEARSISFMPFRSDYFLIGCGDGSIKLFSCHTESPLISVQDGEHPPPLLHIAWSASRPGMFFALSESALGVWDLGRGDILPVARILSKPDSEKLMFDITSVADHKHSYMVLGSSSGEVQVNLLTSAMFCSSYEEQQIELSKFTYYLSII